jgi:hypothetical protein
MLSWHRHGAKIYKEVIHDEILTKIKRKIAINGEITLKGLIK